MDLDIVNDEILTEIVNLISDKATGEVTFCAMYATLCRKMTAELPKKQGWVIGEGNKNAFRGILLRSCQEKFESDTKWAENDAVAQKERKEMLLNLENCTPEQKLEFAQQDYERQKLKQKVLGNIRFVGELFLNGLISENIIWRCLDRMMVNTESPEEEELESLCKLMTAVGKRLDSPKNKVLVEQSFATLDVLAKVESVSSRIRFMLQDVIDLRKENWVPRVTASESAKSLSQVQQEIREDAKKKLNPPKPSRRESDRFERRSDFKDSGRFDRDRKRPEKQRSEDGWTSTAPVGKPANKDVRSAWGRKSQNTGSTPAVKVVEGTRNMFQALGGESASPIQEKVEPEPVVEKSPADIINDAMKEFQESLSPMDLLEDIKNVDDPAMLKLLVSKLVNFLIEKNAVNSFKIFTVFESLFFKEGALYDSQLLIDGFKDFLVNFEEDRYDFPKAFENMAAIFVPAIEKNYLTFENLYEISEPLQNFKGRVPTRPQFAKDLFGGLNTDSEIMEFIITSQFDLKPFFCADLKAEVDEQVLKTWTKNTIAKSCKSISILENIITPVVTSTFELSGTKPTLQHSYRWFNNETDEDLLSDNTFGVWFFTSLVQLVAQKCIVGDKTREVYISIRDEILNLKPLYSQDSLTDTTERRADILIGTEHCLKSRKNLGIQILTLDYLEDFFRIYYEMDLISEEVFDLYQAVGDKTIVESISKWFKYIETQKQSK